MRNALRPSPRPRLGLGALRPLGLVALVLTLGAPRFASGQAAPGSVPGRGAASRAGEGQARASGASSARGSGSGTAEGPRGAGASGAAEGPGGSSASRAAEGPGGAVGADGAPSAAGAVGASSAAGALGAPSEAAQGARGAGAPAEPTSASPAPTAPPAPPPPSPGATASATTAAPRASAATGAPSVLVRVRDRKVFPVLAARGGQGPEARARAASQVLEKAVEEKGAVEVRVEEQGDVAVVFVGPKPLIQLGAEDVAASGDASLGVHAASVAGQVRDALEAERQRSAIAKTVFSISVLVFSALVALLLAREVGRLAARAQRWLGSNPERVPELRFRGIEVIRGAAWRGLLTLSLALGRAFALLAIAYAWLLVALSLFDSTRPYTDQLSGIVFSPLSAAAQRVVGSLPALVVALLALGATLLAVRFVRIFFGSVERGEADPAWLPREFARATGILVRAGAWLGLTLFVLPTLTGSFDGAIARAGSVALLAMGLGAAPLLASAAIGVGAVYGRRLRPGERVELGGRRGRITQVTLTEVRLEDDEGQEVLVPHLLTLAHPTRFGAPPPQTRVEITVSASAGQRALRELLLRAAASLGASAEVELVRLDANGARYRVTVRSGGEASAEGLACALADALNEARVPLGRGAAPSTPPPAAGGGG